MKKVLALLLVSAFVSAAAFAQAAPAAAPAPALKIGGMVETGLDYHISKIGDGPSDFTLQDWDDSGQALRADLNLAYDAPYFGIFTKFRADLPVGSGEAPGNLTPTVFAYNAYGYINLFDKVAVIKAGKLTESVLYSGGDSRWTSAANGLGTYGVLQWDPIYAADLTVTPVTGLTLLYVQRFDPSSSVSSSDVLYNFAVGAKYEMDKVFNVSLGFQSDLDATKKYFGYGFNLLAVPNLTLNAEGAVFVDAAAPRHALDETIGYTVGSLNFSVLMYQLLQHDSTVDSTFNFKPKVAVDLGGPVVALAFYIDTAKLANGTETNWYLQPTLTVPVGPGAAVASGAYIGTNDATASSSSAPKDSIGLHVYTSFEFTF